MTTPKAAPYMKTWVIDEIADTAGMTQAQVGAYWLLKMSMWRAGGKLPAKDAKLADIARCSLEEWLAMKDRVLSPFQRRGGAISQGRMDEAITDYHEAFKSRSKGGKKTASKNANKNNENVVRSADTEHQPSDANQNQNQKEREDDDHRSSSLSCGVQKIPKEIRAAVVRERGEDFAFSYLDQSAWVEGSILPRSGRAMVELARLDCLEKLGVILKLAEGGKAA